MRWPHQSASIITNRLQMSRTRRPGSAWPPSAWITRRTTAARGASCSTRPPALGSTSPGPSCSRRPCTRRAATASSSSTSSRTRASCRASRWTRACSPCLGRTGRRPRRGSTDWPTAVGSTTNRGHALQSGAPSSRSTSRRARRPRRYARMLTGWLATPRKGSLLWLTAHP